MRDWLDENARIRSDWRREAWRNYAVRVCANQAGAVDQLIHGEAGGRFVECTQLPGRRMYMKPRRRSTTVYRAAREKIASDLAADLDVSVPPVMLTDWNAPEGEERYVALSLVLFPRQLSWANVARSLARGGEAAELYLQSLPRSAARAFAFDTWLGQGDHTDRNPHNIAFGFSPDDPAGTGHYIFLDYAFSLGHLGGWSNEEKALTGGPTPFPEIMAERMDRAEAARAADAIAAYPEDRIEAIVARIPFTHANELDKAMMVQGLKLRQKHVPTWVGEL